jgi:hypothetical protein
MAKGAASTGGPGRGHKNAIPKGNSVLLPTLADRGITLKESAQAQRVARAPFAASAFASRSNFSSGMSAAASYREADCF